MPTEEALRQLKLAEEKMKAAQKALFAFIEESNRDFSEKGRAENRALIDDLQKSIDNYWRAFEEAKNS